MNHVRRVGWATAVFAVVLILILWFGWKQWPSMPSGEGQIPVHLDERIELPRDAVPNCDDIRGKASNFAGLRLAVEGMDTGLQAVGCEDGVTPMASFVLRREKHSGLTPQAEQAAWLALLGHPLETLGTAGRPLNYDVCWVREGLPTEHLSQGRPPMVLQIFQWWSPVALLLVLYVWAVLIYLARHTALIRDDALESTPLVQRTFSLSKTQMAWWFSIVFASFIFLWLVTGEVPTISPQALALLGISSATTMASTGIGAGRLSGGGTAGELFLDLLSDNHGVAIHRFQMVVMTAALGLIFLFDVVTKLTMPEFDASLLTLMGLSAATFVGLKISEQRADSISAADPRETRGDAKSAYTPMN